MKTRVQSRIDPKIKREADLVLQTLGVSSQEAIEMFYTQIARQKSLPFDPEIPNPETVEALHNSRSGLNLVRFESVEDLFESWDK